MTDSPDIDFLSKDLLRTAVVGGDLASEDRPQSLQFESFVLQCLRDGLRVRFQARGESMSPAIRDGEMVYVKPASVAHLRRGDIVLAKSDIGFRLHRLARVDAGADAFVTRGDCGQQDDPAVRGEQILGVAVAKDVRIGKRIIRAKLKGIGGLLLRCVSRGQFLLNKVLRPMSAGSGRASAPATRTLLIISVLLAPLWAPSYSTAQVAVDATTTLAGDTAGPGTFTATFNHTTSAAANRLLLVGVSLNIGNSATSTITAITYNGTALTRLTAHNDAANTRRVEIWYLLNPVSGTNTIAISTNVPTAATIGGTAGATTFTGVDQTVPLGTFISADGAGAAYSQLDVPSVVNGMVLDTLAIGSNRTITIPGPQVQQWNLTSGNNGGATDVSGSGSTRTGAPSVPISETFSGNSNWSQGAVSINPTTADVGVTTSVASAVFLGQNTTYSITVSNNGSSAANAVQLTDTLAAGMTLVSVTPSAGVTCVTSANPITCTVGTLASGATATVAVVETAATSGSYANTAVVSDSGTPPDPNTGNNTFVAVATVQSAACAAVSQAVAGNNLTGVLNTYYPGTASVAKGATSIPVGTPTGAGAAIAAGNLLLVIQMQDASINDSNNVAYGNGSTGQGFTALNSAGDYEFVTATGAISGGSVPVAGAGSGGGLVFAYHASAVSATAGQSTYQVIVVPQYTTASFSVASPPKALAWNGSTGGVLVLDTSSTLTLNGATVSVNGQGFRGGAGLQLQGGGGANTDYWESAPATYTGAKEAGWGAPKGEGIAGTPAWIESGASYLSTGTAYPSGTAGTDGSMARGAPGNAGGGGTDGDPQPASPGGNDQNAGGGGGSNGGAGGFGGDSWSSNLSVGGEGGTSFPATINRIAMGGGGGGGTRNNSDGDNQASGGATGGGIIIIRTYALSGTATLTANGSAAYNGTANDAGGGGGAGGTIVVLSANGGEGGLTLQANGGTGGNAWTAQAYSLGNRHGPGGGGGAGVVLVSGTPASVSTTGGASGVTLNPGVTYGATAGAAGFSITNVSISQTSGTQSGAQCTPDMTLGKTHVGNFTRGLTASYTIPVSNLSPYGSSSGTVTVNDILPVGLTPTSASGTGWSCSIASQTVSCVDSTSLAGSSSYPSITIAANVAQTAPSTVTNTALVSGGGEINLSNDSATDAATVVSIADLSVTNAASPNPVAAGNNITYTQIVTNNGPSAADNATLVEAVPANTIFLSISSPAGWSCATPSVGGTGNVVCTNLTMAGNTAATFSMSVRVNSGTASGTVITDTATVSSAVSDPNSNNNSASASTIVGTTAGAELTVTNAASPNPVVAGSNITYTQVVTNTGSAAATGPASFSEATPANTTFVSVAPPAGWTCTAPPVNCTNPSVAAGSTGTFTAIYTVNAGTASGTVISDTATVNAGNQAFGSNSATATDVVATAGQTDLSLSTAATPLTVYSGNDITYTQTVTNNGPATATTVNFMEAIPTNTTFVSVSAPVGWSCTTTTSVTCTDASLASSASADIIVVVNVASTVAVATITASSSVSSTTSDPNSANNSTTVVTNVGTLCDLAVTNGGTPSPVAANSNITYTQVVTNSGPSNCTSATFNEGFPVNTTFVSLTPGTGWTCTTAGSISCTNPTVAPNSTGTFTLVMKVPNGTAGGTIITDTATVASATHDTYPNNNSATVTIGVASATQADVSVTNAASPNPVTAGNNIIYTQTVTNNGPATAGGTVVALFDQPPTNTTYVSLTGPAGWTCGFNSPFYTCSIASLAANSSATFTFVVNVPSTVASGTTISDSASVSAAPTSDPNPNNNSASVSVLVADSADLSVTNTASPTPVQAGNNITYTQVVTNGGPSNATSASFTETTPPNTTFVSLSPVPGGWSCTLPTVGNAGTINCTNPSFAAGSASFPVVLNINAGTVHGTSINDTATVTSSTTDPNTTNNSATATDVVALSTDADLITTNAASPSPVAAGSNVTYTESVTNNGPAAATAPTFTQNTPPNTNFQSITPSAGWTCGTTPAVGSSGAITCTGSLGLNATATFTLVLQVNAGTASGTNIAETVTATASNIVPNLTNNSATATVVVANANSADVAIVKTATPSPTVSDGDTLTYALSVTNNGPATATDVTVTDPLPSNVTYLSVSSTQGSCSQAGGTVTCLLNSITNGATATVTILTLAGAPGLASNTSTVSADQTDPTPANNSSTQTETVTAATKIQLQSFSAQRLKAETDSERVMLSWKTGGEAHNLGFNVYREQSGERVRLNSSLIAGSALMMRGALPKHSGKTYDWIDSSVNAGSSSYWLEDLDVNGTRTLHGPVSAKAVEDSPSATDQSGSVATPETSLTLNQLNQSQPSAGLDGEMGHPVENVLRDLQSTSMQQKKQFELAAHPAVKLAVKHEGWYQVAQPELVRAGFDPNVDPALLHLYAEAIEQPIKIAGASPGRGGFGPQATIGFYGTGIDTPYSGTRIYWLTVGDTPGKRVQQLPFSTGSNQPAPSFPFTVELTPRTTYFAALITSNGNNFFGPLVSTTPLQQTLQVQHLDTASTESEELDVTLQGIILAIPHDVIIALNGTTLGALTFTGQTKGVFRITVPPGLLQEGANTVTLTAQGGEYDTSLIESIRIKYRHLYVADSDRLVFTGRPGDELKLTGFTSAPTLVLDITNPDQPVELTPRVTSDTAAKANGYTLEVQIPWSTNNPALVKLHTLLALADDRVGAVLGIRQNHPSHWHSPQSGSEIVMVSPAPLADALKPLILAHEAAGDSSSLVLIDDLYDEFNFGERSPFAIRSFLQNAVNVWHTAPRFLLLNGRASLDPRNYLGFGHFDFVPTMIVPTTSLMTSSDDWFSDFDNSGMPTIATGRFPVGTPDEARLVASKVAGYEGQSTNGPWTSQALMVADVNDSENFAKDSQVVQAQLPSTVKVADVFATTSSIPSAQQDILMAINSGQLLVNYAGHGSEDQWSGDDLFDNTTANSLTNGSSLPVFFIMDCLNGFFQDPDPDEKPLGVTLMLAPNGGAVAVLASSGLNQAAPQTNLDKLVMQSAMSSPHPAIGEAILKAKAGINDAGVRKTYILFGDPAMHIKLPGTNSVH